MSARRGSARCHRSGAHATTPERRPCYRSLAKLRTASRTASRWPYFLLGTLSILAGCAVFWAAAVAALWSWSAPAVLIGCSVCAYATALAVRRCA